MLCLSLTSIWTVADHVMLCLVTVGLAIVRCLSKHAWLVASFIPGVGMGLCVGEVGRPRWLALTEGTLSWSMLTGLRFMLFILKKQQQSYSRDRAITDCPSPAVIMTDIAKHFTTPHLWLADKSLLYSFSFSLSITMNNVHKIYLEHL